MTADDRLKQVHERLRSQLQITTNIMTPDGRRLATAWIRNDGTPCLVMGVSLDECFRKVLELEADFEEVAQAPP